MKTEEEIKKNIKLMEDMINNSLEVHRIIAEDKTYRAPGSDSFNSLNHYKHINQLNSDIALLRWVLDNES